MCSKYPSKPSSSAESGSSISPRFKVLLPLGLNLHDQRTFQKAKKHGILKPSHLTKLSLVKPRKGFLLHSLLHLVKARHLKSLQYKTYEEYVNDPSNTFGKLLPHSYSKLRKLCIELERCYQSLDGSRTPAIAKTIHIAPTLHELYLKFYSSRRLGSKDVANDRELVNLAQGLCRLVYLKKLHIEFKDCQKISDCGVSRLSTPFSRLLALQDFSFSILKNSTVTDSAIEGVLSSLWRLSNLVSLCLDLNGSHRVGDLSVSALAKVLVGLPQLKRLCIRLDGCQVSYDTAKELLESIEGLEGLEEFELWLGPTRKTKAAPAQSSSVESKSVGETVYIYSIDEEGLVQCINDYINTQYSKEEKRERREHLRIGKTLACLKRLRKANLSIDESWMSGNEVIWGITWALPQLKELAELSLRVSSRNWSETVNDVNIHMLCKAISQLGGTLQKLRLDIQWSKVITDAGMASISESILLLKELKELHLSFEEWNKITDKGISTLARSLSHLNSLERLVLRLTGLYRLEDESLDLLSGALGQLEKLTSLSLNLERCSKVTTKALDRLGDALGKLNCFQELEMDLSGCEEMDKMTISDILIRHLGRLSLVYEISCAKFLMKDSAENEKLRGCLGAKSQEALGTRSSREMQAVVSL